VHHRLVIRDPYPGRVTVTLLERKAARRPPKPLSRMARWWLAQGFTIEECARMYTAMVSLFDTRKPDPHDFM
jgi:hypothetical protein